MTLSAPIPPDMRKLLELLGGTVPENVSRSAT
jgi:hypothetical protein